MNRTAITSSEKQCSHCGETKNLSMFYTHSSRCRTCTAAYNKRKRRERIADLGIDAERERGRLITARSRENPEVYARHQAGMLAIRNAARRLRENHRKEYDHLVREERYAAGLPI